VRRQTSWVDIAVTTTTFTATGGTILNSASADLLSKRPFTIIRLHLELLLISDQVAADEIQIGAIGLCVVSDQSAAAGVASVPTPVTDGSSDLWMMHKWFMDNFLRVGTPASAAHNAKTYTIESKSMRKVNDDQDILLVAELATGFSSGFTISVAGRLLIKEH